MSSFPKRLLRFALRVFGLLLLLVFGLWLYTKPAVNSSTLLISGGNIITMQASSATDKIPPAAPEAVLVKAGRIVAVGRKADLLPMLGDGEQLDLAGDTLMPGLIEPHTHPIASALLGAAVDVSGFRHNSREEVLATLKKAANKKIQLSKWTIAFGWDPVLIEDLEPPTLAELDEISPKRPLLVLTQMMHDAYANSAALAAAGIFDSSENPHDGEFVRGADGKLTGTIRELGAINKIMAAIPKPPAIATELLTQMQLTRYAKAGYTSIGVLGPVGRSEDPLGLLKKLIDTPNAPVRASVWALPSQFAELPSGTSPDDMAPSSRYQLRGVKYWMDGSPFAGGAAWQEPYENTPLTQERLELSKNHRAPVNFEADEFAKRFKQAHQLGWSVAVHVQGERAVDRVLDAVEPIIKAMPKPDVLHRLEHNALITKAQMQRAKSLGFALSFFVDHIYFYGHRLPELVGERAERYMPLRSALLAGHRISLHGDHPATPIDPFRTLNTATSRRSWKSGDPVAADQAITAEQALQAMTLDAAWQLGISDEVGSIEVGKAADFVRLSQSPLHSVETDSSEIVVKATYIAGKPVNSHLLSRRTLSLVWQAFIGLFR